MSTASAGIPSDQPQRTSHHPGSLAVLAATAIGGVLATRLGKAPFVLAAGAAAYALLKQKKTAAPATAPESPPPPAPPQEIPARSQVEQWLSRQISREEQQPVMEFPSTDTAPHEPEDDYYPQSLLLDDPEEPSLFLPSIDSFARLSEPVPQQMQEYITPIGQAPAARVEPESAPPPLQALEATSAITPAVTDAAWTLGVEPLPSLDEAAPLTTFASSMFFTAPVQQEDLEPPPVFSLPMFEGAAFPDEINVPPPFEPAVLEPVVHLTPTPGVEWAPPQEPAPADEPPPVAETTPEISVQLAAPGEASFDLPLAAVPQNPWEPEPDVSSVKPLVPPPSLTSSHVFEAEIILRPRAPMQNSVTNNSKFGSPNFIKKDFPESFDVAPDNSSDNPQPPAREPRSRPSWRSWWRDD